MNSLKSLSALLVLLVLAACGGNGGSPVTSPTPAPVAMSMKKVMQSMATSGYSYNMSMSGNLNGFAVSGSGTAVMSPATQTTWNGAPALSETLVLTGQLAANGISVPFSSTATSYLDPSTYNALVTVGANGTAVKFSGSWPDSVTAGSTGSFQGVIYSDSNMTAQVGTITAAYEVTAKTATALNAKTVLTYTNAAGQTAETATTTYQLNSDGTGKITSIEVATTGVGGLLGGNVTGDLVFTVQ